MATAFAPSRGKAFSQALSAAASSTSRTAAATASLPSFLVPAWQISHSSRRRPFSTTQAQNSKLGRTPISIPPGVELLMGEPKATRVATSYKTEVKKTITIKGPLGTLELDVPEFIQLEKNEEDKTATLSVLDPDVKQQKEMWGTTWSYLSNYVTGVFEGHTAILRLVGVGYRASVEQRGSKEQYPGQRFLCLKLGFTHLIEEGIPKGVTVTTPAPTRILLEGSDREVLMSFAGRVRNRRPPEPYKGKGVFINDETIKLKQKKIK